MTELATLLHEQLATLEIEQDFIDKRRRAIMVLLSSDDMPAATFTANDAKRSEAKRRGGSKNRADISDAQIREIRERARTTSHAKLATAYGVSRSTVGNIVRRKGCYA